MFNFAKFSRHDDDHGKTVPYSDDYASFGESSRWFSQALSCNRSSRGNEFVPLKYDCAKTDITSLCNALRRMPKLKNLVLRIDDLAESIPFEPRYYDAEVMKLFIQVAVFIASQKKDLVVLENEGFVQNSEIFKVMRTTDGSPNIERETLNLTVSLEDVGEFLDKVQDFVRNELDNYHVIVL